MNNLVLGIQIGLSVSAGIIFGTYCGLSLDKYFGTLPVFVVFGVLSGLFFAFVLIFFILKKQQNK